MIIGFAGKKQSGKSTAAALLENAGFEVLSFAETLKLMANKILQGLGYNAMAIASFENHKELKIPELNISMRYLLQTLGTDWGRELINPDLWILIAKCKIESLPGKDIVFDDVRFDNEAALIRELGGLVIHIIRGGLNETLDVHISENGINFESTDKVIFNNQGQEEFYRQILDAINF